VTYWSRSAAETDSPVETTQKRRASLQGLGMDAEEGTSYLLMLLGIKEGTEPLASLGAEAIRIRTFEMIRQMTLRGEACSAGFLSVLAVLCSARYSRRTPRRGRPAAKGGTIMKCPQCQHENPQGARFCEDCAAPLARSCPNCGTALSATAKFCHVCAHPAAGAGTPPRSPESYTPKHLAERILTSRAALEGERKQITVLFADLKGSMELLADRDPSAAKYRIFRLPPVGGDRHGSLPSNSVRPDTP
jgi:hypothetical protein